MLLEADGVVVNNNEVLQVAIESTQIFKLLSTRVHGVILAIQEVFEVLPQARNFKHRVCILLGGSGPEYQFVLSLEPLQ